jgi:ribosomal protein S18 acetylase RimI-like enzyme
VSWFRSSRRRLKARASAEPAGNGRPAAPAREELVGRPLADLHALAREHGVPRYRLIRKEDLIGVLAGDGPAQVGAAPSTPAPAAPAAAVTISEVTSASVEVLEAVQHLIHQLSSTATAPGASDFEEVVGSSATKLLVARGGEGEVVGMLTLALYRIPSGKCAWIEDVVVDERARGHGTGEALTREALRLATEAGATTIDLTSRRDRQAANRLYRKLGFKRRDTNLYRFDG